jgi:rare lipoprotein A
LFLIKNKISKQEIITTPEDKSSGVFCFLALGLFMFASSPTVVNMKYYLLLCGLLLSFTGFAQNISDEEITNSYTESLHNSIESSVENSANVKTKSGYATYYAKRFEGRRTTSGARYRGRQLTAAHLTLPMGTIVTITNLSTGKSVDVVINDRGPHSRKYIIDVSEGAAKELGFYRKGHSKVEISYHLPVD